ncbi:hypothetical protein [Saccharopolyspora griseoalba]|uniref:Integral membrane protein n=1 Tax=Saccharopolyspora griseoalba TaxID=1431848 RepID=A0ABW2LPY2_9PSEU
MTPHSKTVARAWIATAAISLIGTAIGALLMMSGPSASLVLTVTAVEAAIAFPAAFAALRGHNWARITLGVLAFLSVGILFHTLHMQAWPIVILTLTAAIVHDRMASSAQQHGPRLQGGA